MTTPRAPDRPRSFWSDDAGAVLSVDFMLTVPVFLTVFMLVLQIGLALAAQFVVESAAFAACRSAAVWIPADLPGEPRGRMSAGGTKLGHVEAAAEAACVAISPAVGEVGDSTTPSGLEARRVARMPAAALLTRVDLDGKTSWGDRADIVTKVEHDYVLRVPIARAILGRRSFVVAGPWILTIRAQATLTNQGRSHGPRIQ